MSIAPDSHQRQDQNQSLGGLDPNIPKNEPVTPDNALTPDSMTPPTKEERERQKSYAQMRREHETTEQEKKEEEARIAAEPKIAGGHLSVAMQPQPVPVHKGPPGIRPSAQGEIDQREGEVASPRHLEDITLLPEVQRRRRPQAEGRRGPAVPGRRRQDGRGRGGPCRPAARDRRRRRHLAGLRRHHHGPGRLGAARCRDRRGPRPGRGQGQRRQRCEGDRPDQRRADGDGTLLGGRGTGAGTAAPEGGALERRADETDDAFQRRGEAWRQYQRDKAGRDDNVLPRDPPVGQTAEPQWKQGD